MNLEDGWLSHGSEFRSFGPVLLTPFSSLSLSFFKFKYLLHRLGFVNMMREVGWVSTIEGEDCGRLEVPFSV